MPSELPQSDFYRPVEAHLQQGDIFRADVIAPFAEATPRLFRTTDGRHGSAVFTGEAEARVFSIGELNATLSSITIRSDLHTQPFQATHDGLAEMVVTSAELAEYFVLASQTCDICGLDKPAKELAVVLRATPLRTLCMSTLLPLFGSEIAPVSIHAYLTEELRTQELVEATSASYSSVIRRLLHAWEPASKAKKTVRSQIGNALRRLLQGDANLFFLAASEEFGFGELSVDLTTVFTFPTRRLLEIEALRMASLVEAHRNKFAQDFGARFARIAVPVPMIPQTFV